MAPRLPTARLSLSADWKQNPRALKRVSSLDKIKKEKERSAMPLFDIAGIVLGIDDKDVNRQYDFSRFKALNGEERLGLDFEELRRWSENADNLYATLALYHGTRVLQPTGDNEKDILSYVLQSSSGVNGLCLVAGAGMTNMPGISNFHGLCSIERNFGAQFGRLSGSLKERILQLIGIGARFCEFPPKFFQKGFDYRKQERFYAEISCDRAIRDEFYSRLHERSFQILERAMDTTHRFLGRVPHFVEHEHPGRKYMDSALKYFEARAVGGTMG